MGLALANTFAMAQTRDFVTFDEQSANRIELYPNPAVEYLTVEIKESTLKKPVIVLHTIIGNSISIKPEKLSENKFRVNVQDLPDGYYLVSVKDPGTNFNRTYKFLKK